MKLANLHVFISMLLHISVSSGLHTMLLFMRDYDGLCHLGLPCVLSKTCCYAIIRNYNGLWSSQSSRQPKKEVCGVGRDSDIYIRVQRELLLNLSLLKILCINHSIILLYTNIFTSPLVLITSLFLNCPTSKSCVSSIAIFHSTLISLQVHLCTPYFSQRYTYFKYIVTSQHK